MGKKKEKKNVLFGRKNDYDMITLKKVQTLIEASKKIGYSILTIPGVDCIYCYYAGYSFAEISNEVKFVLGDGYKTYFGVNDWNEMKQNYESYLYNSSNNWSNLKKVLEGVAQAQPRDYERHTQHEIAINNIKFSNSSYSVCGFETAIPEHYFAEKKKPEADLVVICPDEHRIILVEFKCRVSSLSGSCGVVKHCTDYIDIVDKCVEIGFIKEMVKAYNLMNKLYGGSADELDASDITKIDIAFLITGSSSKDNDENAKGKIKENNNKSAIKMIKNTKKVSETKKNELYWYWCENYKEAEFTDRNFVSFQTLKN